MHNGQVVTRSRWVKVLEGEMVIQGPEVGVSYTILSPNDGQLPGDL